MITDTYGIILILKWLYRNNSRNKNKPPVTKRVPVLQPSGLKDDSGLPASSAEDPNAAAADDDIDTDFDSSVRGSDESYHSSDVLPLNHVTDWDEWEKTGAWFPPPEHAEKMRKKKEARRARWRRKREEERERRRAKSGDETDGGETDKSVHVSQKGARKARKRVSMEEAGN